MNKELKKYLMRFSPVLMISLPLLVFTQGANASKIIGYKVSMAIIGLALADLHWAVSHKISYGKTEELSSYDKLAVLIFRGLIGGAIVIGCMLGL